MSPREEEIVTKTIEVLKKYVGPQKVYLFGSRSKNTHRKGSDFDFAISGKKPEFTIENKIDEALEEFTGLYKIDIIYLDSVEEDMKNLILTQGKVLYEK